MTIDNKVKIFITESSGRCGKGIIKKFLQEGKGEYEVHVGLSSKNIEELKENLVEFQNEQLIFHEEVNPSNQVQSWSGVLSSMDYLILIPSGDPNQEEFTCKKIDTAIEANKNIHIILCSVLKADQKDYSYGNHFLKLEDHLKQASKHHTIVRSGFYAENLLQCLNFVKKESSNLLLVPFNTKANKFAPIAIEDIATAINSIVDFRKEKDRDGMTFNLPGPALLSAEDIACIFSKIISKVVVAKQSSEEDVKKVFEEFPEYNLNGIMQFYNLVRMGGVVDSFKNDFEQLCPGKTQVSFEVFVKKQAKRVA